MTDFRERSLPSQTPMGSSRISNASMSMTRSMSGLTSIAAPCFYRPTR